MPVSPVRLERTDQQLVIDWSDGQRRVYGFRELQESCPCATCREKRRADPASGPLLPILAPGETQPLELVSMTPVGTYAYHIRFNRGCDSGIYTFEFLRQLGQEAKH